MDRRGLSRWRDMGRDDGESDAFAVAALATTVNEHGELDVAPILLFQGELHELVSVQMMTDYCRWQLLLCPSMEELECTRWLLSRPATGHKGEASATETP